MNQFLQSPETSRDAMNGSNSIRKECRLRQVSCEELRVLCKALDDELERYAKCSAPKHATSAVWSGIVPAAKHLSSVLCQELGPLPGPKLCMTPNYRLGNIESLYAKQLTRNGKTSSAFSSVPHQSDSFDRHSVAW